MAEDDDKKPGENARAFNVFFARLADGDAHREASAELHAMIAKLQTLNRMAPGAKKGKLTITITATVEGDHCVLGYDVTTKEPKPPRKADMAWVSRGGNITYEDPRQMSLKGVRVLPKEQDPRFDDETGEEIPAREAP